MSFRFECGIEARVDTARIPLVNLVPLVGIDMRGLDVALCVVEIVARLRIDASYRTDHLARKQNVIDRNYAREQIDARLVIDAGIEENVIEQVIFQQWLFQLLREPAEATPVIWHGAAAMRDHEAQGWKVAEQVRGQAL